MTLLTVAKKSLLNRKTTTLLTVISIALSVALILGIERIRSGARNSFESTVSGVDLIVGARSGPINLLLYSVFRIGNATNNISYESFKKFSSHESVDWTIPISLGDSHKGFKVIGTNDNYFKHYEYADKRKLNFSEGKPFKEIFDVVLGHDVAKELKYQISDKITLSHGTKEVSFQSHNDKPFTIVGILQKTGTPVDKSLHISLEAIRALHVDWHQGAPPRPDESISPNQILKMNLTPSDVTAFFVRLNSRIAVFNVQREINEYSDEALIAILPGVSLRDLWETIGIFENSLLMVSAFAFLVCLIGMIISLLSTLNERRREMAILRSVGASRRFIFTVLFTETCVLSLSGMTLGLALLYTALACFKPLLESKVGLTLELMAPTQSDLLYLLFIFLGSILASVFPSWRAYKNSLADGLIIKS